MSDAIGRMIVTTRKSHVCFGCGRNFEKGTKMERSFVVDDKPWTCYLCQSCLSVTAKMRWDDEYGFSELREEALKLEQEGAGR